MTRALMHMLNITKVSHMMRLPCFTEKSNQPQFPISKLCLQVLSKYVFEGRLVALHAADGD